MFSNLVSTLMSAFLVASATANGGYDALQHQLTNPHRGIDITPLHRAPSLEPNITLLNRSLRAAVTSDVKECSDLGISIIARGGNAADAAVTVTLCIGAINSFNSGIGGGSFIVSKKYKEEAIAIDAREKAPLMAHQDMFVGREELSKVGGLAVGVPGEVKGLYRLFSTQGSGRLTWQDVIHPVVDLLNQGWTVSDVLGAAIAADAEFFEHNPDDWGYLLSETGKALQPGEWIRRPEMADTLALIANNGSDAIFYDPQGPIVPHLIKTINSHGGIFTAEDFSSYHVNVSKALNTKYLGNDVYTSAGSSSGAGLILGLKIMNTFGENQGGDMTPLATHRLIETMKWMGSGRSRLGDPADPINNNTEAITNDSWTDFARSHFNDTTTHKWKAYVPAYESNDPHGTTHISIVDPENNAVSITSTINLLFGSLVRDTATGIILNNEMDDFSTPGKSNAFGVAPSLHNFIKPGKRPLSSCVPTIVVNELGKPDLIIGAAGGSRITTAVFQAIVRTYSYGFPLLETLAYPRLHHQLLPDVVEHEEMIGSDLKEGLAKRGHILEESFPKTAMNGIRRWEGEWHAVGDYWRKRGAAAVL